MRTAQLEPGDGGIAAVPADDSPEARVGLGRPLHPQLITKLRYLQTLLEFGGSQATTIVFPAPIDLIRPFLERSDGSNGGT